MKLQIIMIKKIPRVNPNHACLTVISLDSAPEKDTSYCLQVKSVNTLRIK